jgi:hypothetical protein
MTRVAKTILCAGAGALAITLSTVAQADDLDKAFAAPPASAKPYARWWWPGGVVDDAELARQLDVMAKSGFGGAEIQAFNPGIPDLTPAERAKVNDYANPAFFAHVQAAARAASAEGLKLDYTFGSAWPSGGGFAITPELALVELSMAVTQVDAAIGGPLKVSIPPRTRKLGALGALDPRSKDPRAAGWRERLEARAKVVAVIAVPGDGPQLQPKPKGGFRLYPWQDVDRSGAVDTARAIVLTDKLGADGTLDWTPPPGRWQVFVFKQYAVDSGVMAGVGEGPQLALDHFRKDAFAAHAARVGDPLTKGPLAAGKGLDATFVDSLELMQDLPWTESFLTEFKTRRGYDLTPYLPLILQPGWMQAWGAHYSPPYFGDDTLGERVRTDYRQTLSDLQLENFWRPFVDWNHAHGLRARVQAHGGSVDTLKAYGLADIPETEDLELGGDPIFMRLARSAADLYGKTLVSAESFVWKDEPFDVTPGRIRQRADLLFASGVNRVVFHGYPYVRRPDQFPGWHAFGPSPFGGGFSTAYNETNPIFAAALALNAYIARTQAVLQTGRNVVPVAVFLGEIGYYHGLEADSRDQPGVEKVLLEAGYDNDRINADALAGARVERGMLVTKGGGRYNALVLPPLAGLPAGVAEKVAALAAKGLKVVFVDTTPERDTGLFEAQTRDRRVIAAIAAARARGAIVAPKAALVTTLAGAGVRPNLKTEGPSPLFVERAYGKKRIYFVHNAQDAARPITFTTTATGRAELWDAWTGLRTPLASRGDPSGSTVSLTLSAGGSAMIVFDPNKKPASPAPAAAEQVRLTLPVDGWSLKAQGHLSKSQAATWSQDNVSLGDWGQNPKLAHFSGRATYARTVTLDASSPKSWSLDLGEVHDLAWVKVNGVDFGPLIGPYTVEVGSALKAGDNQIEVTVINTPNNALVDPTVAAMKLITPKPAGLVGPVRLIAR